MPLDHAGAGARRRHHIVEALEGLHHLARDGDGVGPVAGIVGRLAATGLLPRDLDPRAGVLQQLERREADARPEEVDQAGHE